MAEPFTLEVTYKGQERIFEAELRTFGYTYKIAMQIDGVEVIFEPDEERNFRAILGDTEVSKQSVDTELLAVIVAELEAAFK